MGRQVKKEAEQAQEVVLSSSSKQPPVMEEYAAGTLHPAERSRAVIGDKFLTDRAPYARIDKWEAPGNGPWSLYSIEVLALNASDASRIQTEMHEESCPYCATKKRHTQDLCVSFRRPISWDLLSSLENA